MEHDLYCSAIDIAQRAKERRDWANLPHDFEYAAIKAITEQIRHYWSKRDIRARIAATRAANFYDLIEAIKLANPNLR